MACSTLGDSQLRATIGELNDRDPVRVLHVDDPDFADLVGGYLEREGEGLEVVTEHDVGAALDRLDPGLRARERWFDRCLSFPIPFLPITRS